MSAAMLHAPSRGRSARRTRHTGQALAEFLAVTVGLVPLFLLLPMIGKYQDLNHATQMASRYAAFDATRSGNIANENPWKPPAQLADEVRRRFYSNADAPIKTGDVAGDFDANRNLLWEDPFANPLIKNFSDVAVSFGKDAATQDAGFDSASDGKPFTQVPLAGAGTLGLSARGVYTANVSVALANLPSGIRSIVPFDTLNLSIERHTSLVFDPWSAPRTEVTESRAGKLAPVNAALAALSPAIGTAIEIVDGAEGHPGVTPPKFGDLSIWRDVVPADRLIPDK